MKLITTKTHSSWALVASFILLSLTAVPTLRAERKETIAPGALPPVITESLKKHIPDAEIISVEQEVEGEDPGQYDMVVKSGGKEYDVELTPNGEFLEKKQTARSARAPANIPATAHATPLTAQPAAQNKPSAVRWMIVAFGVAFAAAVAFRVSQRSRG